MMFPLYLIYSIDLQKVDRGKLLNNGETRIKGVLLAADFGVCINYPKKVVGLRVKLNEMDLLKEIKAEGGTINLFVQRQAEVFWVFGITEKDITPWKEGYFDIVKPMEKCIVGNLTAKKR